MLACVKFTNVFQYKYIFRNIQSYIKVQKLIIMNVRQLYVSYVRIVATNNLSSLQLNLQ